MKDRRAYCVCPPAGRLRRKILDIGMEASLLGREASVVRNNGLPKTLKLLVLGARRMLGSNLPITAGEAGHERMGIGHAELEVTESNERRRFDLEIPDAVINYVAWPMSMDSISGAEDSVSSYHFGVGVEHRQVLFTFRGREIEHRGHVVDQPPLA